jgi:hypothetical protein
VDANLRPDLGRILPRPALRPAAGQPFRDRTVVAGTNASPDYLLAIDRRTAPNHDEAGFDLHQAQAAAAQIGRALGGDARPNGLFAPDSDRVQRLLS